MACSWRAERACPPSSRQSDKVVHGAIQAVRYRPGAAVHILPPTRTITLPDDLEHFIAEHGLFEGFTRDDSPGILFILKTGMPWEHLPRELGCGSGMTWRRSLIFQRYVERFCWAFQGI